MRVSERLYPSELNTSLEWVKRDVSGKIYSSEYFTQISERVYYIKQKNQIKIKIVNMIVKSSNWIFDFPCFLHFLLIF